MRETMHDNKVYVKLVRVIHDAIDPYLEGYGGSQVPKLANTILSAFNISPLKMLHRPCSCGSQFQVFGDDLGKDTWLFICNNEGTCCGVISMKIKAKTKDDAWLMLDKGIPKKKSLKETLGKAMDRAEQKAQAENVGPWPNCGQRPQNTIGVVPPKRDTFTFSSNSRLKECVRALVDKLKLINEDPQFKSVWFLAASHGCPYTGPDYGEELKDLEKVLNECM